MRESPDGPALLDIARHVLLRELLPLLPSSNHYAARMVANAMAIAAREARRDPREEAELQYRACALLGLETSQDGWAALAAAIRAGRFDPGTPDHDALTTLLRDYAVARCAISRPARPAS